MSRTCDICGSKIGLKAFHCQDGKICKRCYQIVSNNFMSTIIQKSLSELRAIYDQNAAPIDLGDDGFQITAKVDNVLLIDETRRKFCVMSNTRVTGEYRRPRIFRFEDLDAFKLITEPPRAPEELAAMAEDKKNSVTIKKMGILLRTRGGGRSEIPLVTSPIRSSSYAFRKSYQIALDTLRELGDICQRGKE